MANPTEASIQTQIGRNFLALDELDIQVRRKGAGSSSVRIDEITENRDTEYASGPTSGVEGWRAFLSSALSASVGQGMNDGLLFAYAKNRSFPDNSPGDILERLRRDFHDRAQTIQTRGFNYGAFTGQRLDTNPNVGDGEILRLTVDEKGLDLEAATPENKILECQQDESSGTVTHQEAFEIRGEEAPKDNVADFRSASRQGLVTAVSADDSTDFIGNPSFGQQLVAGETDPTLALPGWIVGKDPSTIGDPANLASSTTEIYRATSGEGTIPASLEFLASEGIHQVFANAEGTFDANSPYFFQVPYKKSVAGVTGTLTVTIGQSVVTVDLSTIADTDWHLLRIPLTAASWFRTFNNQGSLYFAIEADTLAVGTLFVDDVVIVPWSPFDGTYWVAVGGQTPFVVSDAFSGADTANAPETAIISYWLWRSYGRYLPSSGAPTWAEPTP